jgi:hypothetical protein
MQNIKTDVKGKSWAGCDFFGANLAASVNRPGKRGRYGGGAPVVGVGRDLGPASGGGCPLLNLLTAGFGTASDAGFYPDRFRILLDKWCIINA